MRKASRAALMVLALFFVLANTSCDSSLTIINESSYEIIDVRLAPVGTLSWGPNLLGLSLLPGESLTGVVPVSIRKPEERHEYGNRLANWQITLATDIADPVERLMAVRASCAAARHSVDESDRELLHDFMDHWWLYDLVCNKVPPLVRRLIGRPRFNVILSNVRGPQQPMYSAGSRVVALRSMGPLNGDMGLNITAWSYVDKMSVGLVACREHVPDIWTLAELLPDALADLVEAAERTGRLPSEAEAPSSSARAAEPASTPPAA